MALAAQPETPRLKRPPVPPRVEVTEALSESAPQRLTPSEAKQQYKNYKALVDRATEVFGNDLIASRWLSMPSVDLENKAPLQVAQSLNYAPDEMEAVFEPIFIRIEHGIYT